MAMTGSIVAQPAITVNIVGASTLVANTSQKVLFVGQQTTGTATGGALVENIQNDTAAINALFGADSMIAAMIRSARDLNTVTQFDAIPLDDNGGGVDATGDVTVTGTATDDGTVTVVIGSEKNHTLNVAVSNTDSAITIAGNIRTAITADTTIPVLGSGASATVVLTAINAGTLGNDIGISVSSDTPGVSLTITPMTSGSTNPVLTTVLDVVGESRYQAIVWPYVGITAELDVVVDFLDARFNVNNSVQDGVAFGGISDSHANLLVLLNARNSQSLVVFSDKLESIANDYEASAVFELSPVKSSQFAAIRGLRLTTGASISQFVLSNNGPLDSIGGPALASKPYFNTPMPELPLVQTRFGWTQTEIEQLTTAGGSVLGTNPAGNSAIAGEVVTTYKTDAASNPDISFKFLNFVDTSSNAREFYFNNLRSRFAQSRLTAGDVIKGRDMASDIVIAAFCEQLYGELSGADFVLLQAGETALEFYKNNLTVVIDLANGLATITMIVPLVTQLREIQATMQITFSTED